MYSDRNHPKGWGFPIRISPDQSLLAAPRGFSQPATSFIASMRQGIHRTPLLCLIEPVRLTQGLDPEEPNPPRKNEQTRTRPHSTQRDQSSPMPEDIRPDEKPDQPRLCSRITQRPKPQGPPRTDTVVRITSPIYTSNQHPRDTQDPAPCAQYPAFAKPLCFPMMRS